MTASACSGCGTALMTASSRLAGLCASCRDQGPANRRGIPSAERAETRAAQVGGQPWWLCGLFDFVCEYESPERINDEAAAAGPLGWRLLSIATVPGHVNVGRAVSKVVLLGTLGVMTGVSRSDAIILAAWHREPNEEADRANKTPG